MTGGGTGSGGAVAVDEAAVEQVFRTYNQNLTDRDFEAACEHNAPETNDKLLENLRTADIEASNCVEAFTAIYATEDAALIDAIARTVEVDDVTIDGDTATITWSAETDGRRVAIPTPMRRIDGEWKLVDID